MPSLLKRSRTIDVAKGIGILLVILAHISHKDGLNTFVYGFHMPLFFVISGLTFRPEKYARLKDLLREKAKSLLLPYLFFCAFGFLYHFVLLPISHAPLAEYRGLVWKTLWSTVWARYSLRYFVAFNTPLWFVPCLLLTQVIFYLLSKKVRGGRLWVITLVISAAGWVMEADFCPIDFSYLPWNFSSACYSLLFLMAGYSCAPYLRREILDSERTGKLCLKLLVIFLFSMLAACFAAKVNGEVSIGSRHLRNGVLLAISGLAGSLGIISISRLLENCPVLNFFGRNSFTIMGCHVIFMKALTRFLPWCHKRISKRIPTLTHNTWPDLLGKFLLVTILSALFTLVYNTVKNKKRRIIRAK